MPTEEELHLLSKLQDAHEQIASLREQLEDHRVGMNSLILRISVSEEEFQRIAQKGCAECPLVKKIHSIVEGKADEEVSR